MSSKLPLPEDTKRPRVDVVVLVLDMRSVASLNAAKANLELLDADFLLGRTALYVLNVQDRMAHAFTWEHIDREVGNFNLPVFTASETETVGSNSPGATQVATWAAAAGRKRDILP